MGVIRICESLEDQEIKAYNLKSVTWITKLNATSSCNYYPSMLMVHVTYDIKAMFGLVGWGEMEWKRKEL